MPVTLKKSHLGILIALLIFFGGCSQEDSQPQIRGNKNSMIYHWPGCPNYDDIAPHNRVPFWTRQEAEKAGYRAARNCR